MTAVTGARPRPLTQHEVDILAAVAHGRSNAAIAVQFHVSEDTVKRHVRNIMRKLDAHNRAHCVTVGFVRGYLTIPAKMDGGAR